MPCKPRLRAKPGAAKAKAKTVATTRSRRTHVRPPDADRRRWPHRRATARGALEPEARIDLHGMTEAVAHRALATFIRGAAARGCRLVLIVTGKGLKPAEPHEPFDLELVRAPPRRAAAR